MGRRGDVPVGWFCRRRPAIGSLAGGTPALHRQLTTRGGREGSRGRLRTNCPQCKRPTAQQKGLGDRVARATSGGQVTPSGPGQGTGGGTQALGGLGWQGEDRGAESGGKGRKCGPGSVSRASPAGRLPPAFMLRSPSKPALPTASSSSSSSAAEAGSRGSGRPLQQACSSLGRRWQTGSPDFQWGPGARLQQAGVWHRWAPWPGPQCQDSTLCAAAFFRLPQLWEAASRPVGSGSPESRFSGEEEAQLGG